MGQFDKPNVDKTPGENIASIKEGYKKWKDLAEKPQVYRPGVRGGHVYYDYENLFDKGDIERYPDRFADVLWSNDLWDNYKKGINKEVESKTKTYPQPQFWGQSLPGMSATGIIPYIMEHLKDGELKDLKEKGQIAGIAKKAMKMAYKLTEKIEKNTDRDWDDTKRNRNKVIKIALGSSELYLLAGKENLRPLYKNLKELLERNDTEENMKLVNNFLTNNPIEDLSQEVVDKTKEDETWDQILEWKQKLAKEIETGGFK